MAKTMAVVNNGVVSNIIWCADSTPETDEWIDCGDRQVAIGNTYTDGKFYRDDVEVLTPLEDARAQLESLSAQNAEYEAALAEIEAALGVNT